MAGFPWISIAIPDSLFLDEDTLRGKTVKTGQIARAASIFGIERIYIYRDASSNYDREYEITKQILEYAETPQYLRKRLISKKADLEFVGLIPPLKIPHHMKDSNLIVGDIRDAVIVFQNGELLVDVGAGELAKYEGKGQAGQRVTVKITSTRPNKAEQSPVPKNIYWGYEVRRAPTLARFLRSANFTMIILTSRLGDNVVGSFSELSTRARTAERVLVCFGSPESGIDSILKLDNSSRRDFPNSMYLNFFPSQKVATVRLEEAILGVLSIVNVSTMIQI